MLAALRIRRLCLSDLAAQMARLLAAKSVFRSFEKSGLLRVGNQHVAPGVNLHNGILSPCQMQAGEKKEQGLEELLQMLSEGGLGKRKDAALFSSPGLRASQKDRKSPRPPDRCLRVLVSFSTG